MVTLNSIFTSHSVLQANKPVRFFGDGVGHVSVSFNGETKNTVANGKWMLEFDACAYGGPFEISVELDFEKKILEDVWVGDVLLLGGQSNMELKLGQTNFPKEEYRGNENVRLFVVDKLQKEAISSEDGWVMLDGDNAHLFSAIGYHVANALATKDRKIGLIGCYQGASVIQTWMPKEIAELEKYHVEDKYKDHEKYKAHNGYGQLFEYMTAKILPYSMHSVLWYQGESNASDGESRIYLSMLEGLIGSWRDAFEDSSLPFIVVQIADCLSRDTDAWHLIQSEQLRAEKVIPNVRTVICKDVCENDDIHPPTKHLLSKRISDLL